MAKKLYEERNIQAIANALRSKCGTTCGYKTCDMAAAIESISTGGGSSEMSDLALQLISNKDSITSVTIPEGVTTIDEYAFESCLNMQSVTLPQSLQIVKRYGFRNCHKMKLTTELPNSITDIGDYAFCDCWDLSITKLPDSLTTIGTSSFLSCNHIENITIPSGVTTIATSAFNGCEKLQTVTFLGKPTSINKTVFINCFELTEINVPWAEGEVDNAPWGAVNATINYAKTEVEVTYDPEVKELTVSEEAITYDETTNNLTIENSTYDETTGNLTIGG